MKSLSNVFTKQRGSCSNRDELYKYVFARPTRLPTPDHVPLLPDAGLVSPFIGNSQIMYSENIHVAINGEPQHHTPSERATGLSITPFSVFSFQPSRYLQPPIMATEESRVKLESTSYRSSSDKIASNNKHKQSEKHRRDEMGAYVQAGDILRGHLHPAIAVQCKVCIEDTSLHDNLCSPSTMSENVATFAIGVTSNKTKNQKVENSLMWEFSTILHFWPHKVGSRLDRLRAYTDQMRREKELGRNNDFAKSSKWEADSQVEVLTELLRKMRYACELHYVPACATGKHEIEDWPNASLWSLMTPPSSSSRTSPMMTQKRSRETTGEEDEES
jgi:hypothetical protein